MKTLYEPRFLLSIRFQGSTMGKPGFNAKPVKRSECSGWTPAVARRNEIFLHSIDPLSLSGRGFSFTFTIRDLPPSPKDWAKLVKRFLDRLTIDAVSVKTPFKNERIHMRATRIHYVTEFQKRQVPHLHGTVYFPDYNVCDGVYIDHLRSCWSMYARQYTISHLAQDVGCMRNVHGWFAYTAKHAARGANHYQRCFESLPPAWQGQTGRMWGKSGDWPVQDAKRYWIDPEARKELRCRIASRLRERAEQQFFAASRLPSLTVKQRQFRERATQRWARAIEKYLRFGVDVPGANIRSYGFREWILESEVLAIVEAMQREGWYIRPDLSAEGSKGCPRLSLEPLDGGEESGGQAVSS